MTLSTRIGVMHEGEIVQVGEPHEVYEFPNSRFVADFVGSVNMFEGRVIDEGEDFVRIRSPEAGCDIHVGHGISCAPGQTLWFALRPEKIALSRDPTEDKVNLCEGTVEEVAYMGSLSVYRILLDSGKRVHVTRPNIERHGGAEIRWDQRVFLRWDDHAGVVLTA